LTHFFAGLSEYNPVGPLGVDVKMFLYLAGAVQLQLNLLSFAAAHAAARPGGGLAPGAAAYFACLSFFVVEYIFFEEPHVYTYDIFRERLGFKLVWGCTAFYPFFYALPAAFLSTRDDAVPPATAAACAAVYFAGWVLTRGANMQKFACKTGGAPLLCGLVPSRTLPGSRGRLLVSGFWGVARHVNYLGEIVQAAALAALAALGSGSAVPVLYPLYYVALFIPRQADDDEVIRAKYGDKVFKAYVAAVPYRIVPWVF
jgi:protein-S-isoprenylcysteine O-methyltransferase Ste14